MTTNKQTNETNDFFSDSTQNSPLQTTTTTTPSPVPSPLGGGGGGPKENSALAGRSKKIHDEMIHTHTHTRKNEKQKHHMTLLPRKKKQQPKNNIYRSTKSHYMYRGNCNIIPRKIVEIAIIMSLTEMVDYLVKKLQKHQ